MKTELKIHEELRSALIALDEVEKKELRRSIEEEGIREPIISWDGFIVDGHNRYEIAKELGIAYPVKTKEFADLEAAKRFIYTNQLGRRNVTKEYKEYLIGQLYNSEKKSHGGDRNAGTAESTAEKIAEQHDISPSTVKRDADFAKGVDAIAEVAGEKVKADILKGKADVTKTQLQKLGKIADEPDTKKALEELKTKLEKQPLKRDFASTVLKNIEEQKEETKQPSKAKTEYDVAFAKPNYELSDTIDKPSLKKDAVVYILVDDPYLPKALKTLKAWGMEYGGTWVVKNAEGEDGLFNRIEHSHLVYGTQGAPEGLPPKQFSSSFFGLYDPEKLRKLIENNHPNTKRLDTRKGRSERFSGWSHD